MERIWALFREVAWTSVLALVLVVVGIVVAIVAPDFLGLTVALVGGATTLAILSLRS